MFLLFCLIGIGLASPTVDPLPEDGGSIEDRQDPTYPESPKDWFTPDRNGHYHIDDMRYDETQYKLFFGNQEERESVRNAINGNSYRWANGTVPYKFSDAITSANQQKIRDCMNNFNTNFEGCLNVREASSSDANYVEVLAGSGCWSYVGKQGGKQLLNLQPNGCMSCRTIMHEFMHAIGLFHMQSRPDRDDYVQIHFDNIQDGKEHNFNKCESCLTYDVPYDAKSFMHYKYYYFAKDSSKPTISSLSNDFTTQELGASTVLTESDILLLRRMYGCDENFSTTPPPCEKPSWKGDGYCDDMNNVASCDYDGGDCCGDSVVTTYCETCECLDPAFATTTEAPAPACKDNWKAKKCQKRKNKGKCNKKKVKKNCQKTCEFCGKDEIEIEEDEFFDDLFNDDEYSYEMDEDEF